MARAFGAGDLNKRITLRESVSVDNGFGTKSTFVDAATVWANVKWVSDAERFSAGSYEQNITIRFVIRKREIKRDWHILYDHQEFNINGIKEIGSNMLEITAGSI